MIIVVETGPSVPRSYQHPYPVIEENDGGDMEMVVTRRRWVSTSERRSAFGLRMSWQLRILPGRSKQPPIGETL